MHTWTTLSYSAEHGKSTWCTCGRSFPGWTNLETGEVPVREESSPLPWSVYYEIFCTQCRVRIPEIGEPDESILVCIMDTAYILSVHLLWSAMAISARIQSD